MGERRWRISERVGEGLQAIFDFLDVLIVIDENKDAASAWIGVNVENAGNLF